MQIVVVMDRAGTELGTGAQACHVTHHVWPGQRAMPGRGSAHGRAKPQAATATGLARTSPICTQAKQGDGRIGDQGEQEKFRGTTAEVST